jgi:hypothetical protein
MKKEVSGFYHGIKIKQNNISYAGNKLNWFSQPADFLKSAINSYILSEDFEESNLMFSNKGDVNLAKPYVFLVQGEFHFKKIT